LPTGLHKMVQAGKAGYETLGVGLKYTTSTLEAEAEACQKG